MLKRSPSAYERAVAWKAKGEAALPAIREALHSPKPADRHAAALACLWLDPQPIALRDDLLALITDRDGNVQTCAQVALAHMATNDPSLVDALFEAADNPRVKRTTSSGALIQLEPGLLREAARRALREGGRSARELVLMLTWTNATELAPLAEDIEALLKPDSGISRGIILRALAHVDHCSEAVLDALRETIVSPLAHEREAALIAAGDLAPKTAPLIPLLIERLDVETEERLPCAIGCLGAMGPAACDAVPKLIQLVESREGDIKKGIFYSLWALEAFPCETAATALGHIGDPRAIPVFTAALGRRNRELRWRSAEALGQLGAQAREAVPALLRMAKRRTDWIGMAQAIRVLRRIGDASDEVVRTVLSVHGRHGRDSQWTRPQAVLALGVLAGDQPRVRKRLERSRKGHVDGEVLTAHAALARLGEPMEDFLRVWRRELEADHRLVDGLTVDLLETVAPVARESLPEICALIAEFDLASWFPPGEVFPALLAIDPKSPDLRSRLESSLESETFQIRIAARRALMGME